MLWVWMRVWRRREERSSPRPRTGIMCARRRRRLMLLLLLLLRRRLLTVVRLLVQVVLRLLRVARMRLHGRQRVRDARRARCGRGLLLRGLAIPVRLGLHRLVRRLLCLIRRGVVRRRVRRRVPAAAMSRRSSLHGALHLLLLLMRLLLLTRIRLMRVRLALARVRLLASIRLILTWLARIT